MLERQPGENGYDYEERLVRHFCGEDACLTWTPNGSPLSFSPCTKKKGHDGECEFHCPEMRFEIVPIP